MSARTLPDWLQGWAGQIQTAAEVVLILLLLLLVMMTKIDMYFL